MLTRKHLNGLAEALGTRLVEAGMSVPLAAEAAIAIVGDMRRDGLVTPAFDEGRFHCAVVDAAYEATLRIHAREILV
jgi:hypothetical protein